MPTTCSTEIGEKAIEEKVKEFTGGQSKLIRSLVDMDNPDHCNYRGLTQAWFMPPNLKAISARVDALAEKYVDRLEEKGGECDFVSDVAVWYPLRVIMTVLGVPEEDEPIMLKLTQEIFGAQDEDLSGIISEGEQEEEVAVRRAELRLLGGV